MTIVAVVNKADGLGNGDVEFWTEACNQQAREVAAAHSVLYTPVVFFGDTKDLPSDARILTIRNEIDAPGALGYHDVDLEKIFAEVKYTGPETSVTMSHEICEELVDPECNRWLPFDDNHEQAGEASDRVEGDSYSQDTKVMGETRPVSLSNYLLPTAFTPTGLYPFDRMGVLKSWNAMSPGGYVVVRDISTGKVGDVFAQHDDGVGIGGAGRAYQIRRVLSGPGAAARMLERMSHRRSRLLRRLRG